MEWWWSSGSEMRSALDSAVELAQHHDAARLLALCLCSGAALLLAGSIARTLWRMLFVSWEALELLLRAIVSSLLCAALIYLITALYGDDDDEPAAAAAAPWSGMVARAAWSQTYEWLSATLHL